MESFTNLEKRGDNYSPRLYRIDRMQALLAHIGNPERSYKTIHVAGSKGKGSTASFLANSLEALDYKVGLYLSPHLYDYRERFTQATRFFSDTVLLEAANELIDRLEGFSFEEHLGVTHLTAFELFTAFAFLLFALAKCDWAVIETGLGGRLDATNTISPEAVVLTPIELEHTAILGTTLAEIAAEKAKIIKASIPVFVAEQPEAALAVFQAEAAQHKAQLFYLPDWLATLSTTLSWSAQECELSFRDGSHHTLALHMLGEVQASNAALALLVLKHLQLYQPGRTEAALEQTRLPGRFERIGKEPFWYVDGSHTVESLRHLMNSFVQLHGESQNTLIYGALSDKNHAAMIPLLIPHFDQIIIARAGTFKKNDPEALFQLVRTLLPPNSSTQLYLAEEPEEATALALRLTAKQGAVLATGSFYLAGDILNAYRQLTRNNY